VESSLSPGTQKPARTAQNIALRSTAARNGCLYPPCSPGRQVRVARVRAAMLSGLNLTRKSLVLARLPFGPIGQHQAPRGSTRYGRAAAAKGRRSEPAAAGLRSLRGSLQLPLDGARRRTGRGHWGRLPTPACLETSLRYFLAADVAAQALSGCGSFPASSHLEHVHLDHGPVRLGAARGAELEVGVVAPDDEGPARRLARRLRPVPRLACGERAAKGTKGVALPPGCRQRSPWAELVPVSVLH
jgi:hypothetical protein